MFKFKMSKVNIQNFLKFFDLRSKLTQFNLFLILLLIFSSLQSINNFSVFTSIIASTIFFNFIGLIYAFIKRNFYNDKILNPNNILISINIIILIIHQIKPNNNYAFVELLLIITILLITKEINLLKYKGFPIFNPAVLAITLYFLIFDFQMNNTFVSWWGANLNKNIFNIKYLEELVALVLISLMFYFAISFKKIYYAISFLIVYFFIQTFIYLNTNNFYILILPDYPFQKLINLLLGHYNEIISMLGFFVLIMLTEPKTSPNNKKIQIIYGIIGALIYITLNNIKNIINHNINFIDDTELITILIMNLILLFHKIITKKLP